MVLLQTVVLRQGVVVLQTLVLKWSEVLQQTVVLLQTLVFQWSEVLQQTVVLLQIPVFQCSEVLQQDVVLLWLAVLLPTVLTELVHTEHLLNIYLQILRTMVNNTQILRIGNDTFRFSILEAILVRKLQPSIIEHQSSTHRIFLNY